MTTSRFGLQEHLDFLYRNLPRRLALRATSPAAFQLWRQELRAALLELLGLAGREAPPVRAEQLHRIDRGDYVEEKYALDVGEGVEAPIYVLVPRAPPPLKPVLAFAGHNPSVQYILGNYPSEAESAQWRAKDNNYAQALARKGYLVCAVEQRGFGERLSGRTSRAEAPRSCRHLTFAYMMMGRDLFGERCWDGMRAIDYLRTREDIARGPLGCTGNSGGGTTTLLLSALDERITVGVPSCCFSTFKASFMDSPHCECSYQPRILELAEMGELAALIAPRPLRLIAGEQDQGVPIEGARDQFATVRRAYALLGAEDRCSLAVHPGPHAYDHALGQEWFDSWL